MNRHILNHYTIKEKIIHFFCKHNFGLLGEAYSDGTFKRKIWKAYACRKCFKYKFVDIKETKNG